MFESGRQFGHLEERLVTKLSLVSRSEIPEVNKSLLSLLRPFPRFAENSVHPVTLKENPTPQSPRSFLAVLTSGMHVINFC